jgi:hypothetical protein
MCDPDVANVISWEGRSQRKRRAPPLYWDEYVATDTWYTNALIEDVPPDEFDAAVHEDVDDTGEEGDSEPDEPSEDADYVSAEIPSDEEDEESGTESTSGNTTEEEESL